MDMYDGLSTSRLPEWFSGEGTDNDVVISTRIRLARNCANYPFPHRASLLQRKYAYEAITTAFKDSPQYSSFECVNFIDLNSVEQQFFVEERIASPDLAAMTGDRGVIFDDARRISIMVNEEDHLRLQSIGSGCCPLELWTIADGLDDDIGSRIPYAFDNCRGFLTCCSTNAGTGLRVSFLMHLPALILTKTIDQVLLGASQMGATIRGFSGEHSSVTGSLFQVSNMATMGSTESEFLHGITTVISKIIDYERTARQRILTDARSELHDKINRAYGILTNAMLLDVDEFLNLSSALRLGIECSLFNAMNIPLLNRLSLCILPAHLETLHKKPMDDNELRTARAELVRRYFKSLP
jgi:protein arginine kinase